MLVHLRVTKQISYQTYILTQKEVNIFVITRKPVVPKIVINTISNKIEYK